MHFPEGLRTEERNVETAPRSPMGWPASHCRPALFVTVYRFRMVLEPCGTGRMQTISPGWLTLAGYARCVVLLHVASKIIEDTNEVAIKIGGHKLAQLPRFVVGPGSDLLVRGLPLCEEFVHFNLAVEIEPEKDRAYVAVGLSEGAIGDKQSAIPP